MTGSMISWEPVEMDSPRPSQKWLRFRVKTFLNIYYTQELSLVEEKALLADWSDALADVPQAALKQAFKERVRSDNRKRPIPGEIRMSALSIISHTQNLRELEKIRQRREAESERAPPIISLARRREIAAEMGMPGLELFRSALKSMTKVEG